MALASIGSFLVTVVLAISTILLWRQTKRLAAGTEDQHETLKASVDVAKAGVGVASMNVTAAKEALELSNKSFIAMNRPHIRVGAIMADDFGELRSMDVHIQITNNGGSQAIIKKKRAFIFLMDPPTMKYSHGQDIIELLTSDKHVDFDPTMNVGAERWFHARAGVALAEEDRMKIDRGELEWCVSCEITYDDLNGDSREMAVFWVWDRQFRRFKMRPGESGSYEH